jgi:RimJ/RimL family protein N-acetyltransferase
VLVPREIRALISGDTEHASQLAGVLFPTSWPEENEAREGLPWHLKELEANAEHRSWRIRVVVERVTGMVVGSVNLKGPPDEQGDVEIGWGIAHDRRGRGYAFEAALAVMNWAISQPGVTSVSAAIAEDNFVSQHLAARLGLARTDRMRREKPVWWRPAA